MSSLKKRIASLEARFQEWLAEDALKDSDRRHELFDMFRTDSWSDIIAMAVLAPDAVSDLTNLTHEQRKCRVAALLVEAFKRKVAADATAQRSSV